MPGYPTEDPPVSRSRDYRHDRHPPRYCDDYEDGLHRQPSTTSRNPTYAEPRTSQRQRRRDTYDASDEDEYVPRRRQRGDRTSPKQKAELEPDIPPPPIGDRREYTSSRRDRGDYARAADSTAFRDSDGADRNVAYEDDRHRQRKHGRRAYDEAVAMPGEDEKCETRNKSSRSTFGGGHGIDDEPKLRDAAGYEDAPVANERRHRIPGRSPYDEPDVVPVGRKSSRRHRDEYDHDDVQRPRHSELRDPCGAELPRRKNSYADPPRRHDRHAVPVQEDSDCYEPPRRHRDNRDKRRYDDGYTTDRPRRASRDDTHERGYRTDGRDVRHDRDRHTDRRAPKREDRRRDDRRRDDRYDDDHDDPRDSRHGGKPRNGHKHGFDVDNIMQKGQKNWQKVAPVAKPLLAQLAETYLNNGKPGGAALR